MKWIISMPRVDPAMEKGVIVKIMKKKGERVSKDELILKVMTEKATFEVHSPYTGFVSNIFHEEGEELVVGEPILEISEEEVKEDIRGEEILATPAARRLAREHGIDLREIKGTGPQGRITQEDVLLYLSKRKEITEETIPLSPIRKIIALRVEESHRTIPQLAVNMVVKVGKLLKHRNENKFSFDSYFIYASSRALKNFNLLNSYFKENRIIIRKQINIAFALNINDDLYMPVIKNADAKSLMEIDKEHALLVEKAKKGSLSLEDLQDSTFAITNLGPFGILSFNPLIYPSNSAILGIGTVHHIVEFLEDSFIITPAIIMSLSFDHRIVDGVYAARFLNEIKKIIENGDFG